MRAIGHTAGLKGLRDLAGARAVRWANAGVRPEIPEPIPVKIDVIVCIPSASAAGRACRGDPRRKARPTDGGIAVLRSNREGEDKHCQKEDASHPKVRHKAVRKRFSLLVNVVTASDAGARAESGTALEVIPAALRAQQE